MFWFVNCSHAFFTAPFLLSPNFIKSPADKDPRQGRKQIIAKKKQSEKKRKESVVNQCEFGHIAFPAFFGRYTIG